VPVSTDTQNRGHGLSYSMLSNGSRWIHGDRVMLVDVFLYFAAGSTSTQQPLLDYKTWYLTTLMRTTGRRDDIALTNKARHMLHMNPGTVDMSHAIDL